MGNQFSFAEKCFSLCCNRNTQGWNAAASNNIPQQETQTNKMKEWESYWERFDLLIPNFRDKIVVDYGCGFGYDSLYALENGAKHVYCLEISENRLTSSQKLHSSHGYENATYIDNTDIKDLINKIPAQSVDIIFSRDVMEHVPSPIDVLHSMYSITNPGGEIYIGFSPFYKSPYGPHFGSKCKIPWIHLIFSESTILSVFKNLYGLSGSVETYQDIEGSGVNKLSYFEYKSMIDSIPWETEIQQINRFPNKPILMSTLEIFVSLIPFKSLKEIFIVNSYIKFKIPET
ncbi:methyltransferase family protein [Thiogranum longum]|uniref:Methyltransferase family protein n=1 Tax=Thiogranum longum TaxID=1537524 RepID=A0A4R1HFJ0_9GAMM|nr:methyltransferase domain-containing protein [Thiogranum longum]TCK19463.1 methyltransferase family protein [Thiogranum longum]